ncbi:MAG: cytidine deaminase [bacterium]|nr:cytidine deaminase [bacterium]
MDKKILDTLKTYAKNSYSPYSKYKVVAMLFCGSGDVYMGVNVENASYSVTMCAERSALFSAVSNGERKFEGIIIYSPSKVMPYPCGACLQALSEFAGRDFMVTVANDREEISANFKEFFPRSFKL